MRSSWSCQESLLKRFDTTGRKVLGQYDFFEQLGQSFTRPVASQGFRVSLPQAYGKFSEGGSPRVPVRLLVSQLRRSAFDRGSVLGREFFLTKGAQGQPVQGTLNPKPETLNPKPLKEFVGSQTTTQKRPQLQKI